MFHIAFSSTVIRKHRHLFYEMAHKLIPRLCTSETTFHGMRLKDRWLSDCLKIHRLYFTFCSSDIHKLCSISSPEFSWYLRLKMVLQSVIRFPVMSAFNIIILRRVSEMLQYPWPLKCTNATMSFNFLCAFYSS